MVYENLKTESEAFDSGVYEGFWKWGKWDGHGKMSWADNSIFEGEWKFDKRVIGTMVLSDQSTYKGPFKDEMFHG